MIPKINLTILDVTLDSILSDELSACVFKDKRLFDRFQQIVHDSSRNAYSSLPELCEDWSSTKAAYRFLSNDRVDVSEILGGHFHKTAQRIKSCAGPVLILHDTTEYSYKRNAAAEFGIMRTLPSYSESLGMLKKDYTACGLLMHASMAVSPEGLPLGLTAVKYWTRKEFKDTRKMKKRINPTRVPISEKESIKWIENLRKSAQIAETEPTKIIHVCDRENDMFEFFSECENLGTFFLIRACVNRLANETTILEERRNKSGKTKMKSKLLFG